MCAGVMLSQLVFTLAMALSKVVSCRHSPLLFSRYIRALINSVATSGVCCNIAGLWLNILAYADDIVLIAPSLLA